MVIDFNALKEKLAAQKAGAVVSSEVPTTVTQVPASQVQVPVPTTPSEVTKSVSKAESLNQEISLGELNTKIAELSDMLLTAHPRMPLLLREIHSTLKQQPDNITLLSEDEIGIIVSGLIKHTNAGLADKIIKSKTKSIKSISVNDL